MPPSCNRECTHLSSIIGRHSPFLFKPTTHEDYSSAVQGQPPCSIHKLSAEISLEHWLSLCYGSPILKPPFQSLESKIRTPCLTSALSPQSVCTRKGQTEDAPDKFWSDLVQRFQIAKKGPVGHH